MVPAAGPAGRLNEDLQHAAKAPERSVRDRPPPAELERMEERRRER